MCVALPVPTLAQPDQGHGRSQKEKSGYDRSREKRDTSDDQRDNSRDHGQKADRGRSGQQHQATDDDYDYSRSRGEDSGRRDSQDYRAPDDNYDKGRQVQQSESLSPQEAAQRARSQYGGQVLKVQPAGRGYQVRLLQEDGRW